MIDVGEPFASARQASVWLAAAGEDDADADFAVLNRALHAFRLVTADPYVNVVNRRNALVTRIGYGAGEEVAVGAWTVARELGSRPARRRRSRALNPQARMAAVLNGRERALACEELTLRARLDLDQGRDREAALQLLVALDAAIAEIGGEPAGLEDRLDELRAQRDAIALASQSALAGALESSQLATVTATLGRVEALLRARAAVNA